ncbi:hypothetical protein C0992_000395, partial [Termitomyces sp. T32_za158]
EANNIAETSLLDAFPASLPDAIASENSEEDIAKKIVLRSRGRTVYVSDDKVLSLSDSDPGTRSDVSVVKKSSLRESNEQPLSADFPTSKDQQYATLFR